MQKYVKMFFVRHYKYSTNKTSLYLAPVASHIPHSTQSKIVLKQFYKLRIRFHKQRLHLRNFE